VRDFGLGTCLRRGSYFADLFCGRCREVLSRAADTHVHPFVSRHVKNYLLVASFYGTGIVVKTAEVFLEFVHGF